MTRLSSEFLVDIGRELGNYNMELLRKTGCTLRGIASHAAGITEAEVCDASSSISVAVVPITWGKGIIKYFAQAVQSVVSYTGFTSFVTCGCDVAGLAEGIKRGAEIIFLADDNCFVAINLPHRLVVDNSEATGRGYAAALECMVGDLHKRSVLVIGAGRVGRSAVYALKRLGAKIAVFDINQSKAEIVARECEAVREESLAQALQRYTILLDASPAPGIIQAEHITPNTVIAACGIPMGLSAEAYSLVEDRLVHDPLQIGVATMLAMAIKNEGG